MLIRGETTEDRIAKIAQGFGQGFQNMQQGMDRQRQQSLQDEAARRQQAMQALEIEAKLSESTGRDYIGSGAGESYMTGNGLSTDLAGTLKPTLKAEREQAAIFRQQSQDSLNEKAINARIKKDEAAAARGPGDKFKQNEEDRKFKATDSLRKEITAHPATKDMINIDSALGKISTAPDSAYGDMSRIFSYNKLLDPGSTVREGEFANAENAKGWDQKMIGLYNKATKGERLTPGQRKEIMDSVNSLAKAQYQNWKSTLSPQQKRIADLQLDQSQIMPSLSMQGIYDGTKKELEAAKPSTVIQNGVTYNLNPTTGQYE